MSSVPNMCTKEGIIVGLIIRLFLTLQHQLSSDLVCAIDE